MSTIFSSIVFFLILFGRDSICANVLCVVNAGLAASLQQRVLAQMKIKEERDERQKRAEISPIHNGSVTITPTVHIKTEGMSNTST